MQISNNCAFLQFDHVLHVDVEKQQHACVFICLTCDENLKKIIRFSKLISKKDKKKQRLPIFKKLIDFFSKYCKVLCIGKLTRKRLKISYICLSKILSFHILFVVDYIVMVYWMSMCFTYQYEDSIKYMSHIILVGS